MTSRLGTGKWQTFFTVYFEVLHTILIKTATSKFFNIHTSVFLNILLSLKCLGTDRSLMQSTLLYRAGIFKKSMGARNLGGIGLSNRPARLAEFIPWNQFGGPRKHLKLRALNKLALEKQMVCKKWAVAQLFICLC